MSGRGVAVRVWAWRGVTAVVLAVGVLLATPTAAALIAPVPTAPVAQVAR